MKTFETKTCSPKPCTNAPKCEPVACETSWGAWGACTDECDVANGKRYRQLQARGQTLLWVLWRQFETATQHFFHIYASRWSRLFCFADSQETDLRRQGLSKDASGSQEVRLTRDPELCRAVDQLGAGKRSMKYSMKCSMQCFMKCSVECSMECFMK